jgi:hypothetical protein
MATPCPPGARPSMVGVCPTGPMRGGPSPPGRVVESVCARCHPGVSHAPAADRLEQGRARADRRFLADVAVGRRMAEARGLAHAWWAIGANAGAGPPVLLPGIDSGSRRGRASRPCFPGIDLGHRHSLRRRIDASRVSIRASSPPWLSTSMPAAHGPDVGRPRCTRINASHASSDAVARRSVAVAGRPGDERRPEERRPGPEVEAPAREVRPGGAAVGAAVAVRVGSRVDDGLPGQGPKDAISTPRGSGPYSPPCAWN